MGLVLPTFNTGLKPPGFGYGGATDTTAPSSSQSPFQTSSSGGLKNSYSRGFPERLDANQILQGFAPGNTGVDLSGAITAGVQVADVLGRGPAYFAERPAATVQAVFKTVAPQFHIPILSDIGNIVFGTPGQEGSGVLAVAGQALANVGKFVPALMQMDRATLLKQTAGMDPNAVLPQHGGVEYSLAGLFNTQTKTVGELRAEALALGYTPEDIKNLQSGKTSAWDYGDKSLMENPVADMVTKMVLDPTMWAMFAFPPLAIGARFKTFATLVKAGAELEKPLAVGQAARAVATGVAKEATWQGMAHYAGTVFRGGGLADIAAAPVSTLANAGRAVAGVRLAAKAYKTNLKVGIGLGIGEAAISSLSGGAETPKSGFMAPLLELNQKAFDNRPLSNNVAFMLFAAHNFGWTKLIKDVQKAYGSASNRVAGSATELRLVEALADGQGFKRYAQKRAWVYDQIGGKDALNEFIIHVHKAIEFEKIAPELGKTFSHFASLDEVGLTGSSFGRMLQEKVALQYKGSGYDATTTVDMAKRWFGNRRGPEGEAMNAVEFPWNGTDAISEWTRYRAAVEPMVETLNKRLEGLGVSGDVPYPVVQLANELSRGELSTARLALQLRATNDGMVSASDVREMLSRLPQLTDKNFDKTGFWNRILTDTRDVKFADISKRIKHLEKDAPTIRSVTDPQARAEAGASNPEQPAMRPLTTGEAAPHATVDLSQFRPKTFGVDASVSAAINDLGSPAAQRVSSNIVETMQAAGFAVSDATAVIGGNGKGVMSVVLDSGSLEELRVAVAIAGRSIGSNSSVMTVTGERLARLGLRANGVEIIYQVPHVGAMEEVSAIMKRYLPDFVMDTTNGTVRALVRKSGSEDLNVRLEAVHKALADIFKADDVGNTGVVRSTSGAYIETIGRNRATSDFTYQSIAKSTKHDPRWAAEPGIRNGISKLSDANRLDGAGNLGSSTDVGGAQGAGPFYAPSGTALAGTESTLPVTSTAQRVGIGDAATAPSAAGYVYHVTDQVNIESIAQTGLKARLPNEAVTGRTAWVEGGSGKRLWVSDTPADAVTMTGARPGQAMLRVNQSDAGQMRRSPSDSTQFTMKSVPASRVEIYGGDGAWYPLNTFLDNPLGKVGPELAAPFAEVGPIWDRIPAGSRPDNISQALRYQSDAATNLRAGVANPQLEAIRQAVYDAEVAKGFQTIKLHGAWANAPEVIKTQLNAFNTMLRRELPGYELGPSPKLAWLHDTTDNAVVGALRQREGLMLWLSTDSPLAPLGRLKDWLLFAEPTTKFGAAARNALASVLIKNGATPAEVNTFTRGLRHLVDTQQVSKAGVKLFPQATSLPAYQIERLAGETFSKTFIKNVGAKNVYKLLDQSGNRFIRGVQTRQAAGNKVGKLSRSLNTLYHVGQDTPGVRNLRYAKVFYHTFRFTLDVRWHAMNSTESDIIGGLGYGQIRRGHPGTAPPASAFASHAGGAALDDIAATTGWYFPRQLENVISRSFDAARPESTLAVLNALDENNLIALWKHFPDTTGDIRNLAKALDDQLYNFDSVGVKATLEAEVAAQTLTGYSTTLGRDITNQQIAPVLQRLYEVNDGLFKQVVNAFEGNTSRTNLERIMNSYFLYWPLSYQLKAGKWMFDVLTKRIAGKSTVGAGAVTYARLLDAHRDGMATDAGYATMFNDNPSLWFFAQMLLPITPGDLGTSLSRPVRYAGAMLRDATGGDQGPLGFWGDYKAAQDPVTALLAMAEMGPLYTAKLLGKVHNELLPADTTPKVSSLLPEASAGTTGLSLADLGISTAPTIP